MGLDILTPKGQKAAQDQVIAVNAVCRASAGLSFMHSAFDKNGRLPAAAIDGFFMRQIDGNWIGIAAAEVKSREMTLKQLEDWNWEWLITDDKLEDLRLISRMQCIPGVGVLYLVPDGLVLTKLLCNDVGEWQVSIRTGETVTQKTINGGEIERVNSYVNMSGSKRFSIS